MHLWEGVHLAMTWIMAEKLKSFFALVGVIIGVMFLITVVSVVEGMDRYIREDVASTVFGVNTVTLRRWEQVSINTSPEQWRARIRRPRLTWEDVAAIREGLTVPSRVAVESIDTRDVANDEGREAENVRIIGASPELFQVRDWEIERGRIFSGHEEQRGAPVAVLGFQTADLLFPGVDPIGRTVRVEGFPYRVIGVMEEQGSVLGGVSFDGSLVAPARSRISSIVAPHGVVDRIIVQTFDPARLLEARDELEEIMRIRRRLHPREANDFSLETADDALSFWDNISRVLFVALPGLVAVALVVGGIVIMNIMLVSVLERTREIGVRKALGARRRDILTQVLIESATLSGVGALIGVALGVSLATLVAAVSPLPAAVAPRWIVLGMALGVTVGIVAGVYPASRASRLDPVDALRYE